MKKPIAWGSAWMALSLLCLHSTAQLTLGGQLRTRTEFRDGQGAPLPQGTQPAFFTSQRTRLNLGYNYNRLKFFVAAQDVRIWGQDVSTINRSTTQDNNGLMLHEAWAEILLTDSSLKTGSLSLKAGRQELVYDDQRLLGNLDWAQAARRHDAALLKWEGKEIMLHLGVAFNQNRENSAGTTYTNATQGTYAGNTNGGAMYKGMQLLYAGKKLAHGNLSYLFLADQFSKYRMDSINGATVKTYQPGAVSRATTGFYFNNTFNQLGVTASAYYQFGKTSSLQKIRGYLLSLSAQYSLYKTFSAGAGVDYTSGGSTGAASKAFDPLYGTPHKFWGLMDYYYAGSLFGKGGLTDYYIKTRFKPSGKFLLLADAHQFSSAAPVLYAGKAARNLGQEVDLVGNYTLTKQIGFEGGYSRYFSTPLLASAPVKNIPRAKRNANWVYLMIIVKPELLVK
ncbi:MAG: alginate export family protein [Williamsia sp.]|nr:alginate export family protein [Williamsia sp.]